MAIRTANAEWRWNLVQGSGHMRFGSGGLDGPFNFRSRVAEGKGANPEELRGAVHAGCFSMARALPLTNAGVTDKSTHTTTKVDFEERGGGWSIHRIELDTGASISDMTAALEKYAKNAKRNRAISHALSAVDTHLWATSVSFVALGFSSPVFSCDVHARR